ncbi:MAG: hypothetical protein HQL19_03750 [Candidatus Omnitrophica bacterium]|nr:hypothetical protein [Candidatus Omnitrophota bacterium]
MKVSVKKVDALRREMTFEVPKERVTKKLDEVLANIVRHAKMPGFRPGKAPKNMVESAHGKVAREEMLKNLIPEVYQEGLQQEKLDPIDFPMIDQVDMKDGLLKFRATIDLRPDVDVKNYKGLNVVKKSSDVTEEEVNKSIDFFKKGRGGDESAPIDDAFAKSLGFPALEDLKKAIKRNLEMDKERQNRIEMENQLMDALLKNAKLDVPQSLVARQLEMRLDDFRNRMKQYGAKDEDIQKKLEESSKELTSAAEKDVKLYLTLQKIAEIEKIEVKQGEQVAAKVIEFLFKEAKWEEPKA